MPRKVDNKVRKRKGRDIDELYEDITRGKSAKLLEQVPDPDLPGEGQFYCAQCDKYFVDGKTIAKHRTTKPHKRRLKELLETPYSHEESRQAGGMGSYKRPIDIPAILPDPLIKEDVVMKPVEESVVKSDIAEILEKPS